MEIKDLAVTYGVKRSANYQSVDVSATVTVALAAGDKVEAAFKGAMQRLTPLVEAEADAAIRDIGRMEVMG